MTRADRLAADLPRTKAGPAAGSQVWYLPKRRSPASPCGGLMAEFGIPLVIAEILCPPLGIDLPDYFREVWAEADRPR